ncbi:MAG TPA: alpha/beta hydrolase [Solirubrobacteraceae bacterium]|nr:alpha/beta hydrolase [Solirubrobacteraceae bacterium]
MSSVSVSGLWFDRSERKVSMSEYVEVRGIRTWYDQLGEGEPLVLLHPGGAGVDARAWGPNLPALAERFKVFTPERRAHGRTPDTDGPITFDVMADDTIAFLDAVVGEPAHLAGCSDGAIVALLVALRRPDLIRKLVFIAGVFHRDGWEPGVIDPDNTPPEFLERLYGELSPDGPDHYPVVVAKLAKMHLEGPALTVDDLKRIGSRTLVLIGDDDEVGLEHAIELYRSVPDAELAIVPGTSHGLLVEKPTLCNAVIIEFLTKDAVPTMAPIRRASRDEHT